MDTGFSEEELFSSGHSACKGCGAAIALRAISKIISRNTIVVLASGCMQTVSTTYPYTSWKVPCINADSQNAAAIASGIDIALNVKYKDARNRPKIIIIAGDGSSNDSGLGALSSAIERGHNFCYICYDNNGSMDEGYYSSSATPKFAETLNMSTGNNGQGKLTWKKPLPLIIAAHGCRYVATASIAEMDDLTEKIRKGINTPGPAFITIDTPCVPGWQIDSDKTVETSRLGVLTGILPLYEIEQGQLRMTKKVQELKPVREYLQKQGRFKTMNDSELRQFQAHTRWMYDYFCGLEEKGRIFPLI